VLGLVFLVVTAPISAHLLARAALRSGVPMRPAPSIDEYPGDRPGPGS
jgi:multisubunit Na+/H+ antiporter MnhG subunit